MKEKEKNYRIMLTLLGREEMKKRGNWRGFATQIDRFVFALFSLWATSDLGLTHSCSVIFISIQFEVLEDFWWKCMVIKWNSKIVTNNYTSFIKHTLLEKKKFFQRENWPITCMSTIIQTKSSACMHSWFLMGKRRRHLNEKIWIIILSPSM